MKKNYRIEVDCANCANLMQEATRKIEGVENAVVNFMTQKMSAKKNVKIFLRLKMRSIAEKKA